jgi:hypothetical protein
VTAGALDQLLADAAQPTTGVVGPRLVMGSGRPQPSARRFPSPARTLVETSRLHLLLPRATRARWLLGGYFDQDETREVDWVSGRVTSSVATCGTQWPVDRGHLLRLRRLRVLLAGPPRRLHDAFPGRSRGPPRGRCLRERSLAAGRGRRSSPSTTCSCCCRGCGPGGGSGPWPWPRSSPRCPRWSPRRCTPSAAAATPPRARSPGSGSASCSAWPRDGPRRSDRCEPTRSR